MSAVWLATRFYAIAAVQLKPEIVHDITSYEAWTAFLQAGSFPTHDVTWQYPPGAGGVFMAASAMPGDFRTGFTVLCVLVDLAILVALSLAHRTMRPARSAGLWLWASAGVVVGPIMFVRFDLVPTLFAVIAVLLAARPLASGVAAGLGFMVKLWPGLMVLALPRRSFGRGVVAFAITAAAVVGLMTMRFDGVWSFLGNQRDRGLQIESVGALPYEWFAFVGRDVSSRLQYGSVQVTMAGAETVGTIVTALGIAAIAIVAWWRLRGHLESTPAGDVALTLVLLSVAGSRVYSPQFNTWLVGMAAVALMSPRTRLRGVVIIVVAVSLATQVVYPWFPWLLSEGNRWGILAQTLRIVGLLAATGLAMVRIRQYRSAERPERDG